AAVVVVADNEVAWRYTPIAYGVYPGITLRQGVAPGLAGPVRQAEVGFHVHVSGARQVGDFPGGTTCLRVSQIEAAVAQACVRIIDDCLQFLGADQGADVHGATVSVGGFLVSSLFSPLLSKA